MNIGVKNLQEELFVGLQDFHTDRTAMMLEVLERKFGAEIFETVKQAGVDTYGLYKWHMIRTVSMLETLRQAYGTDVIDEVNRVQNNIRYEQGKKLSEKAPTNSLDDIVPYFTFGNNENIIDKTDKYVVIKSPKCMIGKIISELDNPKTAYDLHCGTDKHFVEGFNCNLGCDVTQSIAEGHTYCLHKIYLKDENCCNE